MKIRLDYVTNSSSSSFLVAVRKDTTDKEITDYMGDKIDYEDQDHYDSAIELLKEIRDGLGTLSFGDWNINHYGFDNGGRDYFCLDERSYFQPKSAKPVKKIKIDISGG